MAAQGIPVQGVENIPQRSLPDLAHPFRGEDVFIPQLLDELVDLQKAGQRLQVVPELVTLLPPSAPGSPGR